MNWRRRLARRLRKLARWIEGPPEVNFGSGSAPTTSTGHGYLRSWRMR